MTVWLGFNIPNENLESTYLYSETSMKTIHLNRRSSSTYIRTVGVSSNNLTVLWEFPDSVNLQSVISDAYTSKHGFTLIKVPNK